MGALVSPEYAARLASVPDQRKPWRCCKAPGPQGHLCTERAVRQTDGSYSHTGDHVAEGRAEGEPDSVIASWPTVYASAAGAGRLQVTAAVVATLG